MRFNRSIFFPVSIRAKSSLYSSRGHSVLPIHAVVLALFFSSAPLLFPTLSFAQEEKGGSESKDHNKKNEDCPPGTRGPFATCEQYWEAINKEALRLGYQDGNKEKGPNGTADFLENYTADEHDCADVAAEVACVSNQSECIEQVAKQYRSNMANHSDNYVEGIGECDFTPFISNEPNKGQAGGGLADNPDTTIDDGAPDPGEDVDHAYTCAMNGANRRSIGNGGGAASNMAMMMALSQLLNGMNGGMSGGNGDQNGSGQNQGTPSPGPTPTPTAVATPTCTPKPTPGGTLPTPVAPQTASRYGSSDESNSFGSESKGSAPSKPKAKSVDAGFFSDLPAEDDAAKRRRPNPAWSEFTGDMFDPKDVQ